ncbi:MAG TPA: hypothetical protein VNU66_08855 [Mycobacteriales bacterium]|nr:hypothetical protein [Mycobacteriales bacterium]
MMQTRPRLLRPVVAATSLALLAGTAALASAAGGPPSPPPVEGAPARTVPFALTEDRPVGDRLPRPEDRYAVAGGCYTVQAEGAGYLARTADGVGTAADAASALPLHFQPLRLGEYLLAADEGPDTRYEGAWWSLRSYLAGPDLGLADEPSTDAEWRLEAAGDDPEAKGRDPFPAMALTLPERDLVLAVQDGALALAPEGTEPARLVLRHVRDGAGCAVWPEVQTGADSDPQPVTGRAADRARGFFEAHVHGMAFEFLGGELRCGRPWHPYGVEHALGDCTEEGNPFNAVLEVGLAGQSPADPVTSYDPVGWPTFSYWPQHDTLTHEQFYWRWVERAWAGGLRLVTNLLVDNVALCQAFPVKKNSCNEMDGVRLQAQRLFELQDYVDAQRGGPGEGWLRIVTTPAQARQVINDGRLAVVLGIEVSELFDCREVLDQPQCTTAEIDRRLQEVFDMGVRQMELVNKFDNALSGVTGDGGATGPVVNTGNKSVTGHYWDMRSCEPEGHAHEHGVEGDEHDKTQIVPTDATPGDGEGIDALAGRVLDQFGGISSVVAPVYGPGPHCNTRGLTDLGRHLVTRMVELGMVFDPDHMSASAQREALDLLEELWEQEKAEAAEEGRPAVRPSVISSHSWGNDVSYQRIYQQSGVVAPRTRDAAGFVRSWVRHRDWADRLAPAGYDFGMGYGADTNGLGGQPGPRRAPAVPLDYEGGFEAPIGGVRLQQQTSGLRTYDVSTDGVAHYGLFADWYRELALAADEAAATDAEVARLGGGEGILDDMLDGAETYLQLWERAVYGGGDCVTDGSTLQLEDLHAALGLNLEGFLAAVGQPVDREGSAYRYCVEGEGGAPEVVEVVLDDDGTAVDVSTPGPAPAALTARPGTPDPVDGHTDHRHDATGTGTATATAAAAGSTAGAGAPAPVRALRTAGSAGDGPDLTLPLLAAGVLLLAQVGALALVNAGRRG